MLITNLESDDCEIIKREHIKVCPQCGGSDFVKDYKRDEVYCNECGLVLTNPYPYVGLCKVESVIPHSAPFSARNTVHKSWLSSRDLGKVDNRKTTRYKHRIPNRLLMKKGKR